MILSYNDGTPSERIAMKGGKMIATSSTNTYTADHTWSINGVHLGVFLTSPYVGCVVQTPTRVFWLSKNELLVMLFILSLLIFI